VILFGSTDRAILRVSANGGTAVPATKLEPTEAFHTQPFFLPDGHHFLYTRISPSGGGVYIGSLDAKPEDQSAQRLLTAQFAIYAPGRPSGPGYVIFLRDSSLMAQPFDAGRLELQGDAIPVADPVGLYATRGLFSASASGVLAYQGGSGASGIRLAWYDRQGKLLGEAAPPASYRAPEISPDGGRLALRRLDPQTGNSDIWLIDLIRGGNTRFTSDPAVDGAPVWFPDGSRIVFASNRAGHFDLYVRPTNQSRPEEVLLRSGEDKTAQSISPDGRYVMYSANDVKTGRDLWYVPLSGNVPGAGTPSLFLQTEFRESEAQFSPDGRWVAYSSDATNRSEIYVRPFPPPKEGGAQLMVSNGGGIQPRWNHNGKEILYLSGRKVMSVEVTSNAEFHAGVPKVLFEAPVLSVLGVINEYDWAVTSDGKRFLINSEPVGHEAVPIMVVLNWTEGLRK
jgi:hypothetical protein